MKDILKKFPDQDRREFLAYSGKGIFRSGAHATCRKIECVCQCVT